MLPLPQLTDNMVFAFPGEPIKSATPSAVAFSGRGRIVTVFSPKGGTGKTVLSTNLAAAFAKNEGKRTLLVDLDLQFGDTSIMLGVEPETDPDLGGRLAPASSTPRSSPATWPTMPPGSTFSRPPCAPRKRSS